MYFDLLVLGHISEDNCPIEIKFSTDTQNRKIADGCFRVFDGEVSYEQNASCKNTLKHRVRFAGNMPSFFNL